MEPQAVTPLETQTPQPPKPPKKFLQKRILIPLIILVIVLAAGAGWMLRGNNPAPTATSTTSQATTTPTTTTDQVKNYGDKYADGLLPVGDNKYSTTGAQKGSIYLCHANFGTGHGAGARGPWFTNNNTQWDLNKKPTVSGSVSWTPSMSVKIVNGQRIISTNDLPDHKTGVFPIQRTDPVYKYDGNPSTISAQSLVYSLTAEPTPGDPSCVGGEVGVMLTGVALFDGFDADGRDAGAWEVQDSCDGHPQNKGEYHYHTMSRCITDAGSTTVIGFALDGFPITGPKVADKNIITTDDLDECHGMTSEIVLDGKKVSMYHYVMTQDFPYSVSCFRAKAIQPPGRPE